MKLIIPAYEPDNKLLKLIQDIQANTGYEIIIVDDGSSARCRPVFQAAIIKGCTVLTHTRNQGKGAALKTAFTYLLQNKEAESIVCADCDGQHTWQDIKQITLATAGHNTSIILGCREFVGNVPFKNLIGNKITRGIFSMISGIKIKDTQTGLRGFSPQMLPWLIHLKGNRYEYEMNQLLEAKSAGYELYSIPIATIYENNNEGSHFHPVRDSIRIYLPILKFSLSSISCGILDFVLLLILHRLTDNLMFSVTAARIISSLCNYFLNKNMVFHSKGLHLTAFFKYYALVIFILACNYLLLTFLVDILRLSLVAGKLLTEGILFFLSYIIQQKFIFRK